MQRYQHLPFGTWWQEAQSPCQGEHAEEHSRSQHFRSSPDLQTGCMESPALPGSQGTGKREWEERKRLCHLCAQFIHLREVPGGRASQGGGVLHQDHLPLELLHGDHLVILQPGCLKLVKAGHLFCSANCLVTADC